MNFRKLITYLTMGTAAAMPIATAQNPTILQGNYITNVFGNSNFVLNPNAQTNIANVTTVTATVTRSTTTPLVATSEFTVAIGTANGTATWATRTFDAGMKGQNCEARFSYRGFAATSKVHIKQGANTVATLSLTPSTDPRIASINFPCGDLSAATTFQVTDTAILGGVNEIGGIYVGLATNMANVAQAETVAIVNNSTSTMVNGVSTKIVFTNEVLDVYDEYSTATGIFKAKRAGVYAIEAMTLLTGAGGWAQGEVTELALLKNLAGFTSQRVERQAAGSYYVDGMIVGTISLAVGDEIQLNLFQNSGANINLEGGAARNIMTIKRFPSSSELVVTPERQNVFGGVVYTAGTQTIRSGTLGDGNYFEFNSATWNQPTMLKGKAAVTTTNSGNDFGFSIPNMPVGNYQLTVSGLIQADTGAAPGAVAQNTAICNFKIRETTIGVDVAKQSHQDRVFNTTPFLQTRDWTNTFSGIFSNTSVGTRNFRLEANKLSDNTPGSISGCQVYASTGSSVLNTNLSFLLTPLDQPSNSALYVEGPVKSAGTGAAIPASYVGEVKHNATTPGCGTASQYNDGASVSLTPGIWQVTSQAVLGLTAAATVNNWIVFTGPTTGNSSTWRSGDLNDYSIAGVSIASVPGITQPLLVKYDGTNLFYFANGSYIGSTASASGTIYAKYFRNHSGTCSSVNSSITAIRLN